MKSNKIATLFATGLLLVAAAACSDDDNIKSPLPTASGTLDNSSFNTLSFQWDKVEGALQYSYELTDENGHTIITDVTDITSVTFTDLQPSTDYTLTVLAYAAMGSSQTTSEPLVLHGRTGDIITLATPQPVYVQDLNRITISWTEVADAQSYSYRLLCGDTEIDSGDTKETTLTYGSLESGDYSFTVTANIDLPGYASSTAGGVTFSFTRTHTEVWRVNGTYTSTVLKKSWPATLVSYDDNTYTILGWYGVEGYDITFEVNPTDNTLIMSTDNYAYDKGSDSYLVYTGLSDPTYIYVGPAYSWFEGTSAKGEIGIDLWNVKDYDYTDDTFVWDSMIQLEGSWNMKVKGVTYITDDWNAEDYEFDGTYQITKINDTTYTFPALYFDDETMTVTVDWETGTLTAQPELHWDYYTLSGEDSPKLPVVGKINADGSLTFTGWAAYYGTYTYVEESTATFTR